MTKMPLYSSKAENYARYRWDYAVEAISTIMQMAGVSNDTVVADIGAGTGILTKHFVGRAKTVYAIEPETEMRDLASMLFEGDASCVILDTCAENTSLPDQSVDLILVGQAIHWFAPEPAREEFRRIIKPSGWLAILRNYGTDEEYSRAISPLFEKFSKQAPADRISHQSEHFYYGGQDFQKMLFPFEFLQTWDGFLGSLMSSAFLPDVADENYASFENNAREIYTFLSIDGVLCVKGTTELFLGRITQ
jgi:ubiquinone/menaquinone biosynthesis C-methylase UbiE